MILNSIFEDFVKFTLDFVRKGMNMAFRGLGRSTHFRNPANKKALIYEQTPIKNWQIRYAEMELSKHRLDILVLYLV